MLPVIFASISHPQKMLKMVAILQVVFSCVIRNAVEIAFQEQGLNLLYECMYICIVVIPCSNNDKV